MIQTHILT